MNKTNINTTPERTANMRALAAALGIMYGDRGNLSGVWRYIAGLVERHGADAIARRLEGE